MAEQNVANTQLSLEKKDSVLKETTIAKTFKREFDSLIAHLIGELNIKSLKEIFKLNA